MTPTNLSDLRGLVERLDNGILVQRLPETKIVLDGVWHTSPGAEIRQSNPLGKEAASAITALLDQIEAQASAYADTVVDLRKAQARCEQLEAAVTLGANTLDWIVEAWGHSKDWSDEEGRRATSALMALNRALHDSTAEAVDG